MDAHRTLATHTPVVPELAVPSVVTRVAPRLDAEPEEPILELAVEPARPAATGVRSWPCPVCQVEVPRDQRICPDCGERMFDEAMLLPFDASAVGTSMAPYAKVAPKERWLSEIADLLPMSVAKRVFVYPLLFAFFANLFIPCRFHSTGACALLALLGLIGVYANAKIARD